MPFIIAPLVAALGTAFKWVIATAVGMLLVRIVVALGVGLVTYTGMNYAIDWFEDYLKNSMGALGAGAQIFGLMGLDQGISIIISAMSIGIAIQVVSTSIRKLVF